MNREKRPLHQLKKLSFVAIGSLCVGFTAISAHAADKKPNIVMLMQDDTGFSDFGVYLGGRALGHPTPNIDALPRKAPCSRAGTARPAAQRGVRPSSPGASPSAWRCPSSSFPETRTTCARKRPP